VNGQTGRPCTQTSRSVLRVRSGGHEAPDALAVVVDLAGRLKAGACGNASDA
jgi:hypothetical protein